MSQAILDAITGLQAKFEDANRRMDEQVKSVGSASVEVKNEVKALGEQQYELAKRLQAMEQRSSGAGESEQTAETLGRAFVKSEAYKSVATKAAQTTRFEMETKNTVTTADAQPVAARQPGVLQLVPRRRLLVEQFFNSVPTQDTSFSYARENVFTNNAAEVAEGAAKPESSITFDNVTMGISTVAHWIKITEQLMADAPALVAYIDQAMRYGVDLRVENQLIAGNGVSPNIKGMLTAGNYTAHGYAAAAIAARTTNPNATDLITLVIADMEAAGFNPDLIGLNPADVANLELLKDANGQYVFGGPQRTGPLVIRGRQVVATPAVAVDTFFVGDMAAYGTLYNRQAMAVEIDRMEDDFKKNLRTLRVERRLGLAAERPAAVRGGDLTPA